MAQQPDRPEEEQVDRLDDPSDVDVSSDPNGDDADSVSLRGIASLERLRDRVEVAAHEMRRLREENQALSERIKELETRPAVDPQGTFLSLDHDPELLKRKISGFIEAIDTYLAKERQST